MKFLVDEYYTVMILIFFILGLITGSFLNVLIYRLDTAKSLVFGRSQCPSCQSLIKWYDNIPVLSFFLLGAKCRSCSKNISWQYPLVESFTAIIFALVGWLYFKPEEIATYFTTLNLLVIAGILIVIFVYDLLHMEIPGIVLWVGIAWLIAFNLSYDWYNFSPTEGLLMLRTFSGVLAASLGFIFFFSLAAFSKEKWMGIGDAYLAILLGLFLGWPKIATGMVLGFAIGAVVGIILIAAKKKKMKSELPLAPFLIAGSVIAFSFHSEIVRWYGTLLNFN